MRKNQISYSVQHSRARTANVAGKASDPPPERPSWQAYYAQAKEAYATGDQELAQAYYTYAQHLYDAEDQPASQDAITGQDTGAQEASYYDAGTDQNSMQDQGVEKDSRPSWQAYYNYAQQLLDEGNRQQAEIYYAHAQQLYNGDQEEEVSQAVTAEAVHPKSEPSNDVGNQYSQSVRPSPSLIQEISDLDADAVGLDTVEPISKPRRPLKWHLKVWSLLTLFVLVAGYVGLFFVHQHQQREEKNPVSEFSMASSSSFFSSAMDSVYNATVQNAVDALAPSYDKINRISDAIQPLLYELGLRQTKPAAYQRADQHSSEPQDAERISIVEKTTPQFEAVELPEDALDEPTPAPSPEAPPATTVESKVDAAEEGAEGKIEEQEEAGDAAEAGAVLGGSSSANRPDGDAAQKALDDAKEEKLSEKKQPRRQQRSRKISRAKRNKLKSKRHVSRRAGLQRSKRASGRMESRNKRRARNRRSGKTARNKREKSLTNDPLGTFDL